MNTSFEKLSNLRERQKAIVQGFDKNLCVMVQNRLLDLGFTKGSSIAFHSKSPMGNPKAYLVKNTIIALRDDQTQHILVKIIDE